MNRIDAGREPLPLDHNGYCYSNEQHFDETLARIARDHIARRAQLFEAHLIPLFLLFVLLASIATCIMLSPYAAFAVLPIGPLALFFVVRRESRYTKRIEAAMLCFYCGYSLLRSRTKNGWGVCPECGRPFHRAHYRRPPPLYSRSAAAPAKGGPHMPCP